MKKFFACLIIILATSCEQDIIIDIPPQPVKLVVNGIVRTTTPFRVTIGKTAGVLDTISVSRNRVTDAIVQLYENNILKDTLVYEASSGSYVVKRNTRALSGNVYLLKASAPGFTNVEAETRTPNATPIQSISRRMNVRKDASGNSLDELKITFTDEASPGNHYFFRIRNYRYGGVGVGNPVTYGGIECMRSSDRDIEGRSNGDPIEFETCIDGEFFMRDFNFNGKTKEVILFIDHNALEPVVIPSINRNYKPIVELHSITADQYKYRNSLNAYRDAEDNPFAEPVLVYGNIKNGYGIFVTYDLARDTIR
ncbi:MAG TPA: DUF4249 domain-containing protein [Segetibacter sp.]|jgi:hypothetical protein